MRLSAFLFAMLFVLPAVAQSSQQQSKQSEPGSAIIQCKPTDSPVRREDAGRVNLLLMEMKIKNDGLQESLSQRPEKTSDDLKQLAMLYEAAGKDRHQARAILTNAMNDYYVSKESCKTSPQVQQVSLEAIAKLQMLQCTQNQRMIELLEYIAAKK